MGNFYSGKRTKNLFDPKVATIFKLSRSKIELFRNCPRCFYLDRRLGVGQPPGFPFNLNSAVDQLLKNEFDHYRERGEIHPMIREVGVDAIPCQHEKLSQWRNNFKGIEFHHLKTNLKIFGAIDDLWRLPDQSYVVVDYKATSKNEPVTIDAPWQRSYKRQIELYQWLLRKNGLTVSNTGYFVYCNARRDRPRFDAQLEFDISVIPYTGNDEWVDETVEDAHKCLMSEVVPPASRTCDFCTYRNAVRLAVQET